MSSLLDLLHPLPEPEIFEVPEREISARPEPPRAGRDRNQLAEEQMLLLVRQLFFPQKPKQVRHVAFSAVEESVYIAEICMDAARILAAQSAGSVCVIEANPHNPELENVFGREGPVVAPVREGPFALRNSAQHVSGQLWLAPLRLLLGEGASYPSTLELERRLLDFRLEFDYTILHAPAVGAHSEAVLLGHLSDGVALVLEANATRRASAQKAKETLQSANAKVLGAILSERTFPVPEGLYKRF